MRKSNRVIEDSDSDSDNEPLAKKAQKSATKKVARLKDDSSSSESDIENYLTHPDELDLKSTFFQPTKPKEDGFAEIEKNIMHGVTRLNDSGSENEDDVDEKIEASSGLMLFDQLSKFTKEIEVAKEMFHKYNEKKKAEEMSLDVEHLLAAGEKNLDSNTELLKEANAAFRNGSFHSSDFESCSDSEKEEWEEVGEKKEPAKSEPQKEGIQITVEMPDVIKKKKGIDLLAAMKRRLNRIKKENQVYVHKVHLLTWIAHGNYVNSVLNEETVLGMALSLLPSQAAYPSGRINMKYLEQILNWYKKAIIVKEKPEAKALSLDKSLLLQISKREVCNNNLLVYVFICILRALGIQCRLVLNLQVEPLRPPASELCSLSTKGNEKKKGETSSKRKSSDKCMNDVVKTKIVKEALNKNSAKVKNVKETDTTVKAKTTKEDSNVSSAKVVNENKSKPRKNVPVKTKATKEVSSKDSKTKVETETGVKRRLRSSPVELEIEPSPPKQQKLEVTKESSSKNSIHVEKEVTKARSKSTSEKRTTHKPNTPKKTLKNSIGNKIDVIVNSLEESDNVKIKKVPYIKLQKSDKVKSRPSTLNSKMEVEKGFVGFSPVKKVDPRLSGDEKFLGFTGLTPEKKIKVKENEETGFLGFSPQKVTRSNAKTAKKINLSKLGVKNEEKLSGEEEPSFHGFSPEKLEKPVMKNKVNLDEIKKRTGRVKKVPQTDGIFDSSTDNDDEDVCMNITINQFDGATEDKRESSSSASQKPNLEKLKRAPRECKTKTHERRLKIKPTANNSENEVQKSSLKKSPAPLKKLKVETNNSSPFFNSKADIRKDVVDLVKRGMREQKHREKSRKSRGKVKYEESDSDYADEEVKTKKRDSEGDFVKKVKVKKRVLPKSKLNRKVFSSDDEDDKKPKAKMDKGINIWIEVFLEDEEKWICADVVSAKVHCIKNLRDKATQPVSYILSWDNTSRIKDVTNRYCPNWNTVTRKLRTDPEWWEQSLKPFKGKQTARDKEEDDDLKRQQFEQPLPTIIGEYKNHPLYALQRHLLKFEAIYPPDAPTVGFIRKEAVYPRSCIYTLHSREMWLKEAKVVKPGEKPYKIVKARPKYDKLSNTMITDKPLEIFGIWQVMDYDPPAAENGVVPRNAYGNVELFKPCMLPKNTVHLKLPGLNKVARKLQVDCAPAVVGFDFHGGWNHACYDGYIVCKEHEDILVAAWAEEQEEKEKREQEKYEKRVFGNWRRIIKAVFIREKLKIKYDFGGESSKPAEAYDSSHNDKEDEKPKKKGPRFTINKKNNK